MGVSQRKEAVDYFTTVVCSPEPPPSDDFIKALMRFQKSICSGCELTAIAAPVVEQLVAKDVSNERVRWLLTTCADLLKPCIGNAAAPPEAVAALLTLMEVILRHLLRLTHGQSSTLLRMIEGEVDVKGGTGQPQQQGSKQLTSGISYSRTCEPRIVSPGACLCEELLQYSTRTPLYASSALVHVCVIRLLLTMTSSALHHQTQFDHQHIDVFTEMIMSSDCLPALMSELLMRVTDWGEGRSGLAAAPTFFMEGYQPSVRNLFNLFGSSSTAVSTPKPSSGGSSASGASTRRSTAILTTCCGCDEIAGRHAAALLAVLAVHQKSNGRNPALDYIKSLKNGEPVSFASLLRAVMAKLTVCPCLCVLVYTLFYDHPSFLHQSLSNADVSPQVLGTVNSILHLTYIACTQAEVVSAKTCETTEAVAITAAHGEAAAPLTTDILGNIVNTCVQFSYPFISFMTSTLLLLLSQDSVVNKLVCDTTCKPSFNADRYVGKLSIGCLMITVLCTGVTKALNDRNEALASIFVPCMANLAGFVHDMDAYAAQRLLALLVMIVKKIHRTQEACDAAATTNTAVVLQEDRKDGPVSADNNKSGGVSRGEKGQQQQQQQQKKGRSAEDMAQMRAIGEMYVRQLHVLVEAVEGMLRGRGRNNEALIYELLYNRDKIVHVGSGDNEMEDAEATAKAASCATSFVMSARQILANLIDMITSYEAEIASCSSALSNPAEIMAIIRKSNGSCADGAGGTTSKGEELPKGGKVPGKGFSDMAYTYEESPHSYDFFGPFVWSTLLDDARRPGGVLWCRNPKELPLFLH